MKEKLTSKQKKFALEFLVSGNITDAAKKAGYSERSARQIGSLNLTKPNVVEYMNEILGKTKSEEVATTEEVLEFLTSVMRGDMALKGVLGILRGVANLISSIFKTPVNEVIALFNAMGQVIVKAINNLIDGLNHIKVPDWVPGIGGKGINLSHANFTRVPYLAQGAVIPAGNPFLAVLGDQTKGNNLEMPENLLRKIVSEESGKGTGMIKLVVNLDSRTVLEQLINTAKEMQMSNGQNVFELGR